METEIYPAPWKQSGTGYIILYKFSKEHIEKSKFIKSTFKKKFIGGFGTVMIVNYDKCTAGPYSELLYIPGRFKIDGKKRHTISKIFVSTQTSVDNGIRNWAIPKELANITFKDDSNTQETIEAIDSQGNSFFKISLNSKKTVFPVSTALLPFPLIQDNEKNWLLTDFSGWGLGSLSKIKNFEINENIFPNLSELKPLLCIKMRNFSIRFPIAKPWRKL